MQEVEIVGVAASLEDASRWMRRFTLHEGLTIASQGTLRKYPDCRHWHLRKPGESGTLEATFWPRIGRFWFKVAANRSAEWIAVVLERQETSLAPK